MQRRRRGLAVLRRRTIERTLRFLRRFGVHDARHGRIGRGLLFGLVLGAFRGTFRAGLADRRPVVGRKGGGSDARRLRRGLQQVGHRRHAIGRDVGQDLQHLGPLIEVADADLRIAGRLPQQVFARFGQIRQSTAVGPFGVGLPFDLPPRFRPVEFLGRHVAELLVRFVKLQLAVADFERLPMPFGQLLGDPDRVLLGVEHVERIRRGVDRLSIGKVIGGEDPQLDRLRLDAERLGGEGAFDVERGFVVAADGEHCFCRRPVCRPCRWGCPSTACRRFARRNRRGLARGTRAARESSITRLRGKSSQASCGASSSCAVTAILNGSLQVRPNSSCHCSSNLLRVVDQ